MTFFIHWRGIEDTRWTKLNISLLLPTEQIIKLVEHTVLPLGKTQILWHIESRWNILKVMVKDHGKAKIFLKRTPTFSRKIMNYYFVKNPLHILKWPNKVRSKFRKLFVEIPATKPKWKMRWKKLLPHIRRKIGGAVSGNVSQQIEKISIVLLSS